MGKGTGTPTGGCGSPWICGVCRGFLQYTTFLYIIRLTIVQTPSTHVWSEGGVVTPLAFAVREVPVVPSFHRCRLVPPFPARLPLVPRPCCSIIVPCPPVVPFSLSPAPPTASSPRTVLSASPPSPLAPFPPSFCWRCLVLPPSPSSSCPPLSPSSSCPPLPCPSASCPPPSAL